MTQGEKAKAYDNIIEKANKMHHENCEACQMCIEELIPELKESEDERIREALIKYFTEGREYLSLIPYNKEEVLAWLEKQGKQNHIPKYKVGDTIYYNSFGEIKSMIVANVVTDSTDNPMYEDENGNTVFEKDLIEPKSTDKVEPKFKVGDWILTEQIDNIVNGPYKIKEVNDYGYVLDGIRETVLPFTSEHCMRLWTIQDAKDGDILANWNNTVFIFNKIDDNVVRFFVAYNENWENIRLPNTNSHLGFAEEQFEFHPATKEERDLLFSKVKEAGCEWDENKKELKIIDWSKHIKYEPKSFYY